MDMFSESRSTLAENMNGLFCKVINTAGSSVQWKSAFNHVIFSGAANQVIQFFGANQVLQLAHEAILF
jgi:hypothetical protein